MPVDSLLEQVLRACKKYSQRFTDIGHCPYDLVRPALLKIESPEQLRQLEINSPQIVGRDSEIWLGFMKRDVPNWEAKPHLPRKPENWWRIYRKLRSEAQKEADEAALRLEAVLHKVQEKEKRHNIKRVDWKKMPRLYPTQKQRDAYRDQVGIKVKSRHRPYDSPIMEKIVKSVTHTQKTYICGFRKGKTEVRKAPQAFLEDARRRAGQSASKSSENSNITSQARITPGPENPSTSDQSLQDREARLRALTSGKPVPRKPDLYGARLDGDRNSESKIQQESPDASVLQNPKLKRKASASIFMAPAKRPKLP